MPSVPRRGSRFSLDFNEDDAESTEFRGRSEDRDEEEDNRPKRAPRSTRTEVLPPPPEISGVDGYSEIDGERASTVQGRSSSPRLFVESAGHPTVSQLKIFKVDNGVPVTLGAIDADATEDDLVRTFRASMPKLGDGRTKFVIRPIDSDNRELGLEAVLWMGDDHVAIQRLRARESSANAPSPVVSGGGGGFSPEVMSILGRTLDRSYAVAEAERAHAREHATAISAERIALASTTTQTVQTFAEKMMQTEAQRSEAVRVAVIEQAKAGQESMSAFFGTQLNLMEKAAKEQAERDERERIREQARADRERQEQADRTKELQTQAEKMMQREREYAERRLQEARAEQDARIRDAELKMQREREDAQLRMKEMEIKLAAERQIAQDRAREEREERERRDRNEREDRERKERIEREERERREKAEREDKERKERMERDDMARREEALKREHEWRLKQLEVEAQQRREHDERMAQLQQMQLTAAMQNAAGAKTDLKGLIAEVSTTLQAIGVDPKELVQKVLNPPAPEQDNTAVWAEFAGKVMGTIGEVTKAKMTSDAMRSQGRRQLPPTAQVPQITGNQPAQRTILPQQQAPQNARPTPTPPQARPQATPRAPQQAPTNAQPAAQPQAPTSAPAKPQEVTVTLEQQKSARTALRTMVEKMGKAQESSWTSMIMGGLSANPSVYPYVQAVSVAAALKEAGASEEMIDKIIDGLLEHPLVPDDLNYGVEFEEDEEEEQQTATNPPALLPATQS